MGRHTVEKIGGTSMSRFDRILTDIIIGDRSEPQMYNRIFVVSAYGGVTDLLLENKKSGAPGVYGQFRTGDGTWRDALATIRETMKRFNRRFEKIGLDRAAADAFVDERVDGVLRCLSGLRKVCSYGHFQLDAYLPMVREMLSAMGEAHSAYNATAIIRSRGINALFVDLSGWMEEENLPFDEKITAVFDAIDLATTLPIVTGYTKCSEGIMATFDRGYSEITFSKIATLTKAAEGIIHKEFHLSTGDPKLVGVDNVQVIGQTNYDVADQLADLGMEAIHPKASKSMEQGSIPIRVKNAFEPNHPGTLICSNAFKSETARVEMITGRKDMLGIEVYDPDMVGQSGFDYRILSIFHHYRISYVTKNTNANTITHFIPEKTKNLDLCLAEIRREFATAEIHEFRVAIVCAIGSNMKMPGFLANAANALADAGINILALNQCMRQVNMQFIVKRKDFEAAIIALHRGLVEAG